MKKALLLLILLISFNAYSQREVKQIHSELATKVDSDYIDGMKKMGFSYKITINSKGKVIYIFSRIVINK